jgi:hypothetical protein
VGAAHEPEYKADGDARTSSNRKTGKRLSCLSPCLRVPLVSRMRYFSSHARCTDQPPAAARSSYLASSSPVLATGEATHIFPSSCSASAVVFQAFSLLTLLCATSRAAAALQLHSTSTQQHWQKGISNYIYCI